MAQQQAMRQEAMRSQQQLSEMEARFLKMQAEDLKAVVAKFAEKNGYDFILDSAAAVFSARAADVTDGVLEAMGVDPKTAKRPEAAGNEGK